MTKEQYIRYFLLCATVLEPGEARDEAAMRAALEVAVEVAGVLMACMVVLIASGCSDVLLS